MRTTIPKAAVLLLFCGAVVALVAQACATRTPPDPAYPEPSASQSAAPANKGSDVFMGATKAAPIVHYPQQPAPTQK